MTLPVVRAHTDAVIAALDALGLEVGDAQAPADQTRYVVVYQIPGGSTDGPLGDRNADVTLVYQVTCVAQARKDAEWLADRALELLQGNLTISGRRVLLVALDMHGGIQRDDQVDPPLFWSAPRFSVRTTPS